MKANRTVIAQLVLLAPAGLLGAEVRPCSVAVPNVSFEEPGDQGELPRGWEFHGPSQARRAAWTRETPFEGGRALRIDARHGSQHWQSKAIELPANGEYLLIWRARFQGEKSWRFRAAFCGVEVVVLDVQGQPVHAVRTHSNCWQTQGWQLAWMRVPARDKAKSLVVRFAVESDEALPGGFDVDAVELIPWPPMSTDAEASCMSVHIRNENGLPANARLRVVSSQGIAAQATGAIHYLLGGSLHPLERGACTLLLPPETYTIVATKGFEYWPWRKTVRVERGEAKVDIELQRAWDWDRRGWYSGDHHTHLHRHGGTLFPMLTWPDVARAARCEGLAFLPFMGADRYPAEVTAAAGDLQTSDLVMELTDEITEDFWGHVCPIGARPVDRKDPRYDAGPMNFDRDAAIAGSGMLCYAHPYGPLQDDDELAAIADSNRGLVAREFPIDLALGMRCGIDLLTMEGDRNQLARKLRDVYRLYNLGFRPVLTASTDFHVDQARQPIGAVRTYVRCGDLRMSAVAAAYRAGRTFATNGPLIDLQVGDAAPGDEITLADSHQSLPVSVEAVSIGRLERVEVIVNGQTVHMLTSAEPHRIRGTYSLPASESFWVAVKAVGPENPHLAAELEGRKIGAGQFAHTSPVYVLVKGQPILAGQPADAQYFARWCEATLRAWQTHVLDNPPAGEYDQLVRERLDRAKAVFIELASRL
jgi:hypothetical protein